MSLLDFWYPLTTSPGPGTLDLYLAEHPGRLVIPASRKKAREPRLSLAAPKLRSWTSQGVPIDLTQLKPQDIEKLIEQLDDVTVDVDEPHAKVQLFCQ